MVALRLLAVAAFLVVAIGCGRPDPEEALRERISEMQDGLESRSIERVMAGVDPDFIGPHGLDRAAVDRLLRVQFLRHSTVAVRVGPLDMELYEQRARVRFTAVLTGSRRGWTPDAGRILRVDTSWRQHRGDWYLVAAHWED